jgi:hypothetical protein
MRIRFSSASASLALLYSFLLAPSALAADPPAAPSPEEAVPAPCGGSGPASIDVAWVNIEAKHALERAVCDWFRDERWRVRFTSVRLVPAPRAPETLSIAVELRSAERARLHVTVASKQYWTHDVALSTGLDETGVEIIAQTLHSIADAVTRAAPAAARPKPLAGGAARGAPAANAGPPTPVTEPAPSNPRGPLGDPRAELVPSPAVTAGPDRVGARDVVVAGRALPVHTGIGLVGFLRGQEPMSYGPALGIAVDWSRQQPSLGSFFRAALFTSGEKRVGGLEVKSSGVSLGSGVSLSVPFSALAVRVALGGSADLVALDVQVLAPTELRLSGNRRARPRFFLGAEAGIARRFGAFELELLALVRYQLSHTAYQVQDGQALSTLFESWQLQPGLSLGAGYVW